MLGDWKCLKQFRTGVLCYDESTWWSLLLNAIYYWWNIREKYHVFDIKCDIWYLKVCSNTIEPYSWCIFCEA